MVRAYSQLEGFPGTAEQPEYYRMLANVGQLATQPETELLVAASPSGAIAGAVVFFGDMKHYGSGGTATLEQGAAGFRLLAVDPSTRCQGIGKLLVAACLRKALEKQCRRMVIHTTKAMHSAWRMYEGIGFERAEDLDFMQGDLQVFGFRLSLDIA